MWWIRLSWVLIRTETHWCLISHSSELPAIFLMLLGAFSRGDQRAFNAPKIIWKLSATAKRQHQTWASKKLNTFKKWSFELYTVTSLVTGLICWHFQGSTYFFEILEKHPLCFGQKILASFSKIHPLFRSSGQQGGGYQGIAPEAEKRVFGMERYIMSAEIPVYRSPPVACQCHSDGSSKGGGHILWPLLPRSMMQESAKLVLASFG